MILSWALWKLFSRRIQRRSIMHKRAGFWIKYKKTHFPWDAIFLSLPRSATVWRSFPWHIEIDQAAGKQHAAYNPGHDRNQQTHFNFAQPNSKLYFGSKSFIIQLFTPKMSYSYVLGLFVRMSSIRAILRHESCGWFFVKANRVWFEIGFKL